MLLNISSGSTRFQQTVNIDLHDGPTIDVIAANKCLLFQPSCVDLVILQKLLEHISYPDLVPREIARVLRLAGYCYCQILFKIG